MAEKRKPRKRQTTKIRGVIEGAGIVEEQVISNTLTQNYMPYAMSVIMSRAIPEIDGFKPSHRKLLYTMYKMGLLGNTRTKSANIVGQTMKLNPHGDSAIYETMVRLSRGYEALLHPFIDSKGNFGKFYSRDMAYAASRYTEAKLDSLCNELFSDIDKDTIDFVDNYDSTMKEPTLLPCTFPSVLVNANTGLAVGMASSICSFNLREVCLTTIEVIKDEKFDIMETLPAPDFSGGGQIIYNKETFENIYKTGKGSFKVRGRYYYDKSENCIDILSIPQTTTGEAIIEKVIDLVKTNKIREISDIRDETGIDGFKVTIDLKKGTDPDKLMQRLYKMTKLEDSFSCNFNVLIAGVPRVLGVKELMQECIAFRRTYFDLKKKSEKLHLLKGLQCILLDIDKAIKIVRETKEDKLVIKNLMDGFLIDEIQAEYVAEIKLRNLNEEFILKRINEINQLEKDIENLEQILKSNTKIKNIIIKELKNVADKYGMPRKSILIFAEDINDVDIIEEVPDYNVNLFFTKHGYFKKITPLSLRMGGEQNIKEDDIIIQTYETTNNIDLLFFTNKCQVYKAKAYDFADTKASVLGTYIPAKLSMDENETALKMIATKDYKGFVIFAFENGKVAKVDLDAYKTKTNRKKLANAYSDKSTLVDIYFSESDTDYVLSSTSGRKMLFNSEKIGIKTTKNTQGVNVMKFNKGHKLGKMEIYVEGMLEKPVRYISKTLPSAGAIPTQSELNYKLEIK